MGKTCVVFIENSSYDNLADLDGPSRDAQIIKEALGSYKVNILIHKINLTRDNMTDFFSGELPALISSNKIKTLFIWYAGHGKFDDKSYWLPVDAIDGDPESYIETRFITTEIGRYEDLIHILLVNDASGSGPGFLSASRIAPMVPECDDAEALGLHSAQILSSTGRENAADDSEFADAFAAELDYNDNDCIAIQSLVTNVRLAMRYGNGQKTQFGIIFGLKHEGGTFFFFKNKE